MPAAKGYIQIVLLGMVMTMLYNACASILRAVGDTTAPLAFLVLSSILNVFLDLFFILVLHSGVKGAAIATVLSQSLSAVLSLCYMIKRYPIFRFHIRDFKITRGEIRQLYSSGISMALMMSLVFFGTLSLQSAINLLGTNIIVAHTAARKITEFFMLPFSVMGVTMANFCGQNMGAGKTARIHKGISQALIITSIWSVAMILLSYTVAPYLVYLVTGSLNRDIALTAALYLKINSLFYFVPAAISIFRNALQGCGDHKTPVVSSFIELAGKVVIAAFLAPVLKYMGIIVAEPIVWILMVIPLTLKIRKLSGLTPDKR
jgi:Na+-driven multidrug efflux pump